jgi:adenylosuccinate lyase
MRENLGLLKGVVHSQSVLLALAEKGYDRQAAYVLVQRNAMKVYDEAVTFQQALEKDAELSKVLTREELTALFDDQKHLAHVDEVFQRVFGRA